MSHLQSHSCIKCNYTQFANAFPNVPHQCRRPENATIPGTASPVPPESSQHMPVPNPQDSSACSPQHPTDGIRWYQNWLMQEAAETKTKIRNARFSEGQALAQRLLKSALPGFQAQRMDRISTRRLFQRYRVESYDGSSFMIAVPPLTYDYLTHEQDGLMRSEAALLNWLNTAPGATQLPPPPSSLPVCSHRFSSTEAANASQDLLPAIIDQNKAHEPFTCGLDAFLPQLVEHGYVEDTRNMLADRHAEYILAKPVRGDAIAALRMPLTPQERASVDRQAGRLLRLMSTIIAPTRLFGNAADVLRYPLTRATIARNPHAGLSEHVGFTCWSDAFLNMLENGIRDCRECKIRIPQDLVRYQGERFRLLLDRVTCPRLVVIDVADDTNILVRRNRSRSQSQESSSPIAKNEEESEQQHAVEVTGLCDWSYCIFGDPLLAGIFNAAPSHEFRQGFETTSPVQEAELRPIQNQTSACVRLLLYEMYHAITVLARDDPDRLGGSRRVRDKARQRLTSALERLEALDNQGQPL